MNRRQVLKAAVAGIPAAALAPITQAIASGHAGRHRIVWVALCRPVAMTSDWLPTASEYMTRQRMKGRTVAAVIERGHEDSLVAIEHEVASAAAGEAMLRNMNARLECHDESFEGEFGILKSIGFVDASQCFDPVRFIEVSRDSEAKNAQRVANRANLQVIELRKRVEELEKRQETQVVNILETGQKRTPITKSREPLPPTTTKLF